MNTKFPTNTSPFIPSYNKHGMITSKMDALRYTKPSSSQILNDDQETQTTTDLELSAVYSNNTKESTDDVLTYESPPIKNTPLVAPPQTVFNLHHFLKK